MTTDDVPADAGDVEALAEVVGHVLSEYLDDAAPLNERRYVVAARHVLSVDGSPGMTAYFAARDAAQRADERERIAQAIETLAKRIGGVAEMWEREGELEVTVPLRVAERELLDLARAGTAGGSDA